MIAERATEALDFFTVSFGENVVSVVPIIIPLSETKSIASYDQWLLDTSLYVNALEEKQKIERNKKNNEQLNKQKNSSYKLKITFVHFDPQHAIT